MDDSAIFELFCCMNCENALGFVHVYGYQKSTTRSFLRNVGFDRSSRTTKLVNH